MGQGAEGVAQLMLGGHQDLPDDSLHIRKTYDPYSQITQGDTTTKLLQHKVEANKALQEAAARQGGHVAVPSMGGVVVKNPGVEGMTRHQSVHQFVPQMEQYQQMPGMLQSPGVKSNAKEVVKSLRQGKLMEAAQNVKKTISGIREAPLEQASQVLGEAAKKTGRPIGDVVIRRLPFGVGHKINPGNIVSAGGKPTILDTLPISKELLQHVQAQGAGRMGRLARKVLGANTEQLASMVQSPQGEFLKAFVHQPTPATTIQREFYNPKVPAKLEAPATLREAGQFLMRGPKIRRAAKLLRQKLAK